jgi:hypothetical protein
MTIAVVGGTGKEGFGLVLRLAKAGERVVIGSRAEERGVASAEKARQALGSDARVEGAENAAAAAAADVIFVTVPFVAQADIYKSIRDAVPAGAVVCDTTTPLATAVGGRAWQVLHPWQGSAAEQAKELLAREVRLVAGFHTVSSEALQELDRIMDDDVLLCGNDAEAKAAVGELVEKIPNLRWVDCGPLSSARVIEPMTALLIDVNRAYKIHDAGIRITGRDSWGRPG